jgi:hypothetical protein
MNRQWKRLFQRTNEPPRADQALPYLRGELPAEEQHALESAGEQDPFWQDAMEGLAQENPNDVERQSQHINQQLLAQLSRRKSKNKKRWKDNGQVYIVIVCLLLLLVVAFWVVRKFLT